MFPHPCQHTHGMSVFFNLVIRMSVEQYLTMALIFISLMTNDVETLFMCLLAIHVSSLVKCLSKFKLHIFKLSRCLRTEFLEFFTYFLDTNLLSDIYFVNIFS